MFAKTLFWSLAVVGVLSLVSCGQPPAPCPEPVQQKSEILGEAVVMTAAFRGSSFRSSSSFRSAPRFRAPAYKPAPKNTVIINKHYSNGGSSNGLLWGLGGYWLGQQSAQNATRCQ